VSTIKLIIEGAGFCECLSVLLKAAVMKYKKVFFCQEPCEIEPDL
jgi:hypothetical protein